MEIKDANDLELIPIVAGPACQTHRIINLSGILLKPLIKYFPSFLRKTTVFFLRIFQTECQKKNNSSII